MTATETTIAPPSAPGLPWRAKLAVVLLVILAVVVVLVSNRLLTNRYTADTRSRAEVRLALYTGNLKAELQRTSVVPLLLASDPDLRKALKDGNFSATSAKLISRFCSGCTKIRSQSASAMARITTVQRACTPLMMDSDDPTGKVRASTCSAQSASL